MKKKINILGLLIVMNSQTPQKCLRNIQGPPRHNTLWESQHHTANSLDVKTEHFKFTLQRLLSPPYTLYIVIHLTVSEQRTNWSKWRGIQILAWIALSRILCYTL